MFCCVKIFAKILNRNDKNRLLAIIFPRCFQLILIINLSKLIKIKINSHKTVWEYYSQNSIFCQILVTLGIELHRGRKIDNEYFPMIMSIFKKLTLRAMINFYDDQNDPNWDQDRVNSMFFHILRFQKRWPLFWSFGHIPKNSDHFWKHGR